MASLLSIDDSTFLSIPLKRNVLSSIASKLVFQFELGMTTKSIPMVTHPNQTQFDGFSPF
jgi:hypothetical protein